MHPTTLGENCTLETANLVGKYGRGTSSIYPLLPPPSLARSATYQRLFERFLYVLGVGRVSFSALGLGFGILDFARVGFRVKEIWFGSSLGQIFFHFSLVNSATKSFQK